MPDNLFENDRTEHRVTFKDENGAVVNISGAVLEFKYKPGSASAFTVIPTLFTDGSDGIAKHEFAEDELTPTGRWKFLAKATTSGKQFTYGDDQGQPVEFDVHPYL